MFYIGSSIHRSMSISNLAELIGKDVYTKNAKYVGKVDDTMVDSERGAVYGVVIQMAKDSFLYQMFEQNWKEYKKYRTGIYYYRVPYKKGWFQDKTRSTFKGGTYRGF